jgi:hypothetical protein
VSLPVDGAVDMPFAGAGDASVLDGVGVGAGSVAGFGMSCGEADCVVVGSELLAAGVVEPSLLVCAETKPTVPTMVAAVIAAVRILEALMVELLGRCRPVAGPWVRDKRPIENGWFNLRSRAAFAGSADRRDPCRTSEVTKCKPALRRGALPGRK